MGNADKLHEALSILHSIEEKYFDKWQVLFFLGVQYYRLENYPRSVKYLKKAVKMKPDAEIASFCYFLSLYKQEKVTIAHREMERYLGSNRGTQLTLYNVTLREFLNQFDNDTPPEERELYERYYEEFVVSLN